MTFTSSLALWSSLSWWWSLPFTLKAKWREESGSTELALISCLHWALLSQYWNKASNIIGIQGYSRRLTSLKVFAYRLLHPILATHLNTTIHNTSLYTYLVSNCSSCSKWADLLIQIESCIALPLSSTSEVYCTSFTVKACAAIKGSWSTYTVSAQIPWEFCAFLECCKWFDILKHILAHVSS